MVKNTTFATDFSSPPGRAFQTGQPVSIRNFAENPELKLSRPLADHGDIALSNVPIILEGVIGLIGSALRRERVERSRKDAVAATALEAEKRTLLLSEMHHRVRNNFQIILAMMAMNQKRLPTDEARPIMSQVAEKIAAIALARDQPSPKQEGHVVNLPNCLRALTGSIQNTVEGLAMDVEGDELELSIEQSVPLGLIVNELVTNSIKHAYDGAGGSVRVELNAGVAPGEAALTVADSGKGFRQDARPGTGTQLLDALVAQINGRLDRESSAEGTTTQVLFPI